MLTDALFEEGLPWHELEAQSILNHGEAPAGERGDSGQSLGEHAPDDWMGDLPAVGDILARAALAQRL